MTFGKKEKKLIEEIREIVNPYCPPNPIAGEWEEAVQKARELEDSGIMIGRMHGVSIPRGSRKTLDIAVVGEEILAMELAQHIANNNSTGKYWTVNEYTNVAGNGLAFITPSREYVRVYPLIRNRINKTEFENGVPLDGIVHVQKGSASDVYSSDYQTRIDAVIRLLHDESDEPWRNREVPYIDYMLIAQNYSDRIRTTLLDADARKGGMNKLKEKVIDELTSYIFR